MQLQNIQILINKCSLYFYLWLHLIPQQNEHYLLQIEIYFILIQGKKANHLVFTKSSYLFLIWQFVFIYSENGWIRMLIPWLYSLNWKAWMDLGKKKFLFIYFSFNLALLFFRHVRPRIMVLWKGIRGWILPIF